MRGGGLTPMSPKSDGDLSPDYYNRKPHMELVYICILIKRYFIGRLN